MSDGPVERTTPETIEERHWREECARYRDLCQRLERSSDEYVTERDALRKTVRAAHGKIGDARRIVDEFWRRQDAHDPYDRETAWAMHVALVQLAEVLAK